MPVPVVPVTVRGMTRIPARPTGRHVTVTVTVTVMAVKVTSPQPDTRMMTRTQGTVTASAA
jgi:hypothetical protein